MGFWGFGGASMGHECLAVGRRRARARRWCMIFLAVGRRRARARQWRLPRIVVVRGGQRARTRAVTEPNRGGQRAYTREVTEAAWLHPRAR